MAQDDVEIQRADEMMQVVPLKGGGGSTQQQQVADKDTTTFLRVSRNGDKKKLIELIQQNCDIINASNNNGLNALHLATKEAHRSVCLELIHHGININSATKKGNTALHIAALSGNLEILRILHANGADLDVQTQNGFTALYMAAQENHLDCVQFLIENGCNTRLTTVDGFTPLDVAIQQGHKQVSQFLLKSLAQNGKRPMMQQVARNGSLEAAGAPSGKENGTAGQGNNNSGQKKYKLHALHLAAKKNDVKNGEFLLREMNVSPNITSKSGFTPMHIAAHYDNVDFGRLLLAEGGDRCQVNFRAKHQITPIHVACKWGRINFLRFLLENGADIYAQTKDKLTPLHCASRSGHLNCIEALLGQNFNLIEARTKNGLSPLHMTVQGNHVEATRYLIEVSPNSVHNLSDDSLTPLHIAVHYNFYELTELLLENGANCYVRATNGFTPVHIACKKKFYDILVLLMRYMNRRVTDCVEGEEEPEQRNRPLDASALQVAVEMGSIEVIKFLLEHEPTIQREIAASQTSSGVPARRFGEVEAENQGAENGAGGGGQRAEIKLEHRFLDWANERGETPLHIGVMTGNLEIVKFLLEQPRRDDAGNTSMAPPPLASAANMVSNGALNQGTVGDNQGPIFYAIRQLRDCQPDAATENDLSEEERNKFNLVRFLVENGADLGQRTVRNHWTPFMYAVKLRLHFVVQYLIDYVWTHNSREAANEQLFDLINRQKLKRNKFNSVHLAIKNNDLPMLKILLRNGGNLNEKTVSGYTPFILACHYGHEEIIQFLLHLYEQFETNKERILTVHYNRKDGQQPSSSDEESDGGGGAAGGDDFLYKDRFLLDKLYVEGGQAAAGGDGNLNPDDRIIEKRYLFNINQKTDAGNTALHQAVQQNHLMIIKLLLSNNKFDANETNQMNVTPLELAQRFHLIEIVKEFQFVLEEKIVDTKTKIGDGQWDDEKMSALRQMPEDEALGDDIENEDVEHEIVKMKRFEKNNAEINFGQEEEEVGNGKEEDELQQQMFHDQMDSGNMTNNLSIMDHLLETTTSTQHQLHNDQSHDHDEDIDVDFQPESERPPPVQGGFLVSFLVDARGGEMQGCRQSGIRVMVPPKACQQPMRITCRFIRSSALGAKAVGTVGQQITAPPLMEGEALVSQILELGPVGAKFLGPVTLEIPHFANLRGSERELVVLRSETGSDVWREHINAALPDEDPHLQQPKGIKSVNQKLTLYCDSFPNYFAIISRIKQEIFIIGPSGGRLINDNLVKQVGDGKTGDVEQLNDDDVSSVSKDESGSADVIVEAHFPENALTKNIRVGLQVRDTRIETNREIENLLNLHTSPVVTIEPRRRKFHKAITLVIPIVIPVDEVKSFSIKHLHLFCSITGGHHNSQWEDVTGSTPLQLFNVKGGEGPKNKNLKYISFTTTVSARFWLVYFNLSPTLLAANYKFYFDQDKGKYLISMKPSGGGGGGNKVANESMANINLFHYLVNDLNFLTNVYTYLAKVPIYCKIKLFLIKNYDEHQQQAGGGAATAQVLAEGGEGKVKFLMVISNCVSGDVQFAKKGAAGMGSKANSCVDIAEHEGEFVQVFETKKIEFVKDVEIRLNIIPQQAGEHKTWTFQLNKKNENLTGTNEMRFTLNDAIVLNRKIYFDLVFRDVVISEEHLVQPTDNLKFVFSSQVPAIRAHNASPPREETVHEIDFEREQRVCQLVFSLIKYSGVFARELAQQGHRTRTELSADYGFGAIGGESGAYGYAGQNCLFKEVKINLNDLVNMLLGDEWQALGQLLDVSRQDVEIIRDEFPGNAQKCGMVMMKLFLKQQEQTMDPKNKNFYFAVGKKLESALIEINRFDVVEKLFRVEGGIKQQEREKQGGGGDGTAAKGQNGGLGEGEQEEQFRNGQGEEEEEKVGQENASGATAAAAADRVITMRATNEEYSDDNLEKEEDLSVLSSPNLKSESESENALYESTTHTNTNTSPTSESESIATSLNASTTSANNNGTLTTTVSGGGSGTGSGSGKGSQIPMLKSNSTGSSGAGQKSNNNNNGKKKNNKKNKNKKGGGGADEIPQDN